MDVFYMIDTGILRL